MAVVRAQLVDQSIDAFTSEIQDAAIVRFLLIARFGLVIGTFGAGKQPVEYHAGIHLFDGRSGFVVPRNVTGITAGVAGIAAPFHPAVVESQLQRGEAGFVPDRMRDDLVGRDATFNIVRRGLSNMHPREIARDGFGMIAHRIEPRRCHVEAAQDEKIVAVLFQRLK